MMSTPNGASGVSLSSKPLSIVPVRSSVDLRQFFDVTRHVYADDVNFVQPLTLERLDHLNPKKNPAFASIEIAYWVVFRGTSPVGRISCQINQAHLALYQDKTAHFGFFEAIDDDEVIELLFSTAEIWARERGMERLQGPFSVSINDESGLLIDGFDRPPNMMMPHGRPYYDARMQSSGFTKAKDLIAYDMDVSAPWPKDAQRLIDRTARMSGMQFRPLDMSKYAKEISLICDIFNDAWSQNWNFIPFGEAEGVYLAKSIRPIVNKDCFAIGELNGEPVAMSVTLPNLNEAIADLDGKVLPFGWAKVLWRLKVKGVTSWRMPLMGLRKHLQGTLKGAAMTLGVIDRIKRFHQSQGVLTGELSWILEDNDAIKTVIDTVGGKPYKTYRIYERPIA